MQDSPGTVISDGSWLEEEGVDITGVKGFATIDAVSLINVEGTGMVGVPGTASAIFTTIRDAGVNVIMISQASSEHSVCFAVKAGDAPRAVAALRTRFADAIRAGRISAVDSHEGCSVLAAVGSSMASRRGVAATMFAALAAANINVRAIAQGCSEYNITALVDARESTRALRAVHGRFYMQALPLGIGLIGPGLIGSTLLSQIHDQVRSGPVFRGGTGSVRAQGPGRPGPDKPELPRHAPGRGQCVACTPVLDLCSAVAVSLWHAAGTCDMRACMHACTLVQHVRPWRGHTPH